MRIDSYDLRRVLATASLLSLSLLAIPAHAQVSGEAEANSNAPIIVTAQRKEQLLEDVPASVTVVTAEALDSRGVTNMHELGETVAGVQINLSGAYTQPTVRGISALVTGYGKEMNVPLYVDGFYQPDVVALNAEFANLESIQVLKGPQGSLWGRNATGGVLLVNTQRPSETFTGKLKAEYGNFDQRRLAGFISGPITDELRFSVAGSYYKSDGYYKHLDENGEVDGNAAPIHSYSVRSKVEIEPSSGFRATLGYNFVEHSDARGSMFSAVEFSRFGQNSEIGTNSSNNPNIQRIKVWEPTLKLEIETEIGKITSYTAYADRYFKSRFDFDGLPLNAFWSKNDYWQDSFQHNTDFNITAIDGLDLILGGGYWDDSVDHHNTGVTSAPVSGSRNRFSTKAWSLFADATLDLTDRLFLNVSGRFSHEKSGLDTVRVDPISRLPLDEPTVLSETFKKFTPSASLRYEVAPDTNLYASFTRGFRSGLIQTLGGGVGYPVKQETITAYEVGLKTAQRTFRFDLAAFYYDYKDIQVGVTITNPRGEEFGPINLIDNAPKAEVYGVEGQLSWSPVDGLTVDVSANWLHARYIDFDNATGNGWNAATGLNVTSQAQDWSGQQMVRAPDFSATMAVSYEIQDVAGGSLIPSVNAKYTDSYVTNNPSVWGPLAGAALADKQRYRIDSYTLINASLTWNDASEHFSLGAWIKNLTDAEYFVARNGGSFGDYTTIAWPRTYGVNATYRF